jgi:HK97 family phage major capsid protein
MEKEKWQLLNGQAADLAAKAIAVYENDEATEDEIKQADTWNAEAEGLRERAKKLKSASGIIAEVRAPALDNFQFPQGEDGSPHVKSPVDSEGDIDEAALIKAVNVLRYGQVDNDPTAMVMREIYGGDYRQGFFEQDRAYARYLRTGIADPVLRRQYWGPQDVVKMLRYGFTVNEIKSTMVEGQDTLGGYAVPPQRAQDILMRLPGLTAMRGGGARIVQTASNMIEWLKVTGGGSQYPSGITGAWGAETQSPTEKNFTVGLSQIPVHVYTYKVPMSQSLVEDATNLIDIFAGLVTNTLAIDEDTAFLVGDGAGKPRGVLPSSTNTDSITEVVSGNASALTAAGCKSLRRGVKSQYRAGASWIGNSDTAGDIEVFQDGIGRFYFEYLEEGERFLRHSWRESESMPDVASDAYPLIFGDLSGYMIVERLGLSIVRFQDSNTGVNKVEFHIRRRIGGRVVEPWKFAVQKVAAS